MTDPPISIYTGIDTTSRGGLVVLMPILILAEACAPGARHGLFQGNSGPICAHSVYQQSGVEGPAGEVVDRSGADESELDVWVTFAGENWNDVWSDWLTERATEAVIARLRKYKAEPETYFARLPRGATRWIPWHARIKMEIALHRLIGDNDIHFSEWWISKDWWR